MATLTGNPSMAHRIARVLPTLTRSHRQIADYVLAHPLQAATMPIDELASTVGVSVATANRFARALEFEGYPQFRAALVLGFETTLAPVEKLRSKLARSATVSDVLSTTLAGIQRNIESTRQALDPHTCERAVDAILKARRICVAGFGSSSWLAGLLQRSLDPYCENVELLASIEGSSHGAKVLTRLQSSDLFIAIAYPRYLADTVLLARRAREGGVPVLALTDRVTSPLARLGTVSLYAHTDSQYFANSDASAFALMEALCGAVAHRAKGSLQAATQVAESVLPWLHGSHGGRLRPLADAGAPGQGKRRRAESPGAAK
jgi:DNA-binding MurR/RpiR family transcriptional regulator